MAPGDDIYGPCLLSVCRRIRFVFFFFWYVGMIDSTFVKERPVSSVDLISFFTSGRQKDAIFDRTLALH